MNAKILLGRRQKMNCESCKYPLDKHSHSKDEKYTPKKGDFSICLNCGSLYTFNSDLIPNRKMLFDDLVKIKNRDPELFLELTGLQLAIINSKHYLANYFTPHEKKS